MYKQRDIETLWSKYEGLLKSLKDENIIKLLDDQGQRILMTSFSQREKEPFCGIGGIVDYSLKLAKNANAFCKALNYDVDKGSIIKCSLLSIVGRIGTSFEDRFTETTSEWHKEKLGQYFDWNENCPKYQINDMTLWFLQHYNIKLSWSEWNAIFLLKDLSSEDNKFYSSHKSRLSLILNLSHSATLKDEFDEINGSYTIPF